MKKKSENLKTPPKPRVDIAGVKGSIFKKGDRVIVFDAYEWSKTGDIGNNEQFYKSATVMFVRMDESKRWLADVIFDYQSTTKILSRGHFQDCMKYCP
jgi:5-hydroxyisourate hydrolase-like protein (transthyretin family)